MFSSLPGLPLAGDPELARQSMLRTRRGLLETCAVERGELTLPAPYQALAARMNRLMDAAGLRTRI
jgi:hypothetical protein